MNAIAQTTAHLIEIDGHTDLNSAGGHYSFPLDEAVTGGLAAAVVPAHAGLIRRIADPGSGADELEGTCNAILDTVAQSQGRAALASEPQQVVTNAAEGVFSFILGFQNARPLADLDAVKKWIDRGVAVFDFGFIGNNQWVKSSRPYPYANTDEQFDGISEQAVEAIALLNENRVIIDTAQVSPEARRRIIELSTAPVIASHNGLKAKIGEADRTISDDEVRAIAEGGGLVNVVAFDGYLTARGTHPLVVSEIRELRERFGLPGYTGPVDYYAVVDPESANWDEQKFTDYFREYHAKARHDWPRSDVSRLIDAVDHVVELVGIDHVGIASDFHHGGGIKGWLNYLDTPNVTTELRRRYSEEDTAKIWGGNLLALWGRVRGR